MAHKDKEKLTGPGDGPRGDAATGETPAAGSGAPVPQDGQDAGMGSPGGDGTSAVADEREAPRVPVDPARRPAGFAADYLPPDAQSSLAQPSSAQPFSAQSYSGQSYSGQPSSAQPSSAQPSSAQREDQYSGRSGEDDTASAAGYEPDASWASSDPSQGYGQASPYGDYEPSAYGYGDQDYGQHAGYAPGYGPSEGYGYPPGYGDPYGTAQPYGGAPAYGYPDERYGYGDSPGYGYGPDQAYSPGPGYGEAGGHPPGQGYGYPPGPPYGAGDAGQYHDAGQPSGSARPYVVEQAYGGALEAGAEQAPGQAPEPAADEAGRDQMTGGEPGRPVTRGPGGTEAAAPASSGAQDGGRLLAPPPRPPQPDRFRGHGARYQELGPQAVDAQRGGPQPIAEVLAPLPDHGQDQYPAETADDLTVEALLPGKGRMPGGGWRRLVYRSTGGRVRPRESAETLRRRELINRVRTPVAGGHHRVAVMSLKGGVGKTTTTVGLGSMLASLRGDRIIALDANPDRGTLSDKVRLETSATVRDLLNERGQIRRYADVRAFTSQAPSRLEVLASDRDPAVSVAFCEEDYYDAAQVLEHYYSISLTDCGTGLLHSAMAGVLRLADQIILVSSPSVDGARSASATLDWLEAHEYGDLVRNAVVVLSMIRPRSKSSVDLDRLEHHFAGRCRAVARIPYDAHLEEGAEVDVELMSPATVDAYLVLAATVGDGFAWPRRVVRQMGLGRAQTLPGTRLSHRRRG